jgi:hypothetical protein
MDRAGPWFVLEGIMRAFLSFVGLCVMLAAPGWAQAADFDWLTWERLSERRVQDPVPQRFALKGHVFSIYPANAEHPALFVVERRGRILHLGTADRFNVIAYRETDRGEGPDLLIDGQSAAGGTGARLHAFALGPKFALQTIGLGDAFTGVDETGEASGARVQFSDYAFVGWNAAAPDSPAPILGLIWTGERYAVDRETLRRARLPDAAERRHTREAKEALDAWKARGGSYVAQGARAGGATSAPPPLLWRYMLGMIYSGDAPAAKRLFESAWSEEIAGKREFWLDFLVRLRGGQAWRDLDLETALDARALFDDLLANVN